MISIYNNIKNNIIISYNNGEHPNKEIEVRFTEFSMKRGVTLRTFNRISNIYSNYEKINKITTDYISNNMRQTINPGGEIEYITKESVWSTLNGTSKFLNEYGLKFDVSTEININVPNNWESLPKIIRNKNRTSYIMNNGLRLDITIVSMTNELKEENVTYEIELELLDVTLIDNFFTEINKILSIIQNSDIIYSRQEYEDIIYYTNSSLSQYFKFDKKLLGNDILMQAINLHYSDLKQGKLIPNPNEEGNSNKLTKETISYRATVKSDGLRKMLLYYNNTLYFVMTPGEINKFYKFDVDPFGGKLDNIIFDGELIPLEKRKRITLKDGEKIIGINSKYYYLIFDILKVNTDLDVRKEYHEIRMRYAESAKDILSLELTNIKSDILTIDVKGFYKFKDAEEFFMSMRVMEDNKLNLLYEDDGYIFVPNEYPYTSLYPKYSILKWKPLDKLTIDLAIYKRLNVNGKENIYMFSLESPKLFLSYDSTKYILSGTGSTDQKGNIMKGSTYQGISYEGISIYFPSLLKINEKIIKSRIIGEKIKNVTLTFDPQNFKFIETSSDILDNELDVDSNVYKKWNICNSYLIQYEKLPDNKKSAAIMALSKQPLISINIKLKYIIINNIIIIEIYTSKGYKPFNHPINQNNKLLENLPSYTVVEFKWDPINMFFDAVQVRSDKPYPNSYKVSDDIYNLIIDPIDIETLKGMTITLMRKYHNRIKRRLLNSTINGLNYIGKTLLDIGSGKGGDVNKWKNFERIICIEPNEEFIIELINRIKQHTNTQNSPIIIKSENDLVNIKNIDRFVIVNTSAENYHLITMVCNSFLGGKVDIISSMLSMSFLWKSQDIFNGFIKTITNNLINGGIFLYLTIDGDSVEQYFDPYFKGPIPEEVNMLNGKIQLKYEKSQYEQKQLYINFPDSLTVKNQIESLVYLDALRSNLPNNYKELIFYRADQEAFLNSSERIISSMYSYGAFKI